MEELGKHSYYCVYCGEEIKPEQAAEKTMVALSYAALDGMLESSIEKTPVYITRGQLEKLISRTDAEGRQYLTLFEYLQFAYNTRNRKDLNEEKAKDAETALQVYHERKAEFEARVAERDADPDDDEEEPEIEFEIPGFSDTATAQIIKNFPDDICHLEWSVNKTNGYFYWLYEKNAGKNNLRKRVTPCWVCASCREEILSCAFDYRHILIGLIGFRSAGKTCLIAALCHTLLKQGGTLLATKKDQKDCQDLLADYIGGYTLAKTRPQSGINMNTFHPSVQKDSILWTFVDIPGESFFKTDELKMDIETLTGDPKLSMSFKCHGYILAADEDIISDHLKRSNTLSTFELFINLTNEMNHNARQGTPLVFALTKVDEVLPGEEQKNLPAYCIADSYPKNYRTELSIIRNKGLAAFLDTLIKKNYVFATTCAPYGFKPLPADNPNRGEFKTRDHKEKWIQDYKNEHPEIDFEEEPVPHPVYQPANPRNVGLIMDWLEKLFGMRSIVYDSENDKLEKKDLSAESWNEGHFDDTLVSMIACMFCNPNDCDLRWYRTMGDFPLLKRMKQRMIRARFSSKRR